MLSKQQQAIVNSEAEKILIIAGAGCGKTFTLVEKIKLLLKKEMMAILVISFTNMACFEIESRINNSAIEVLTFHKLAVKILKLAHLKHTYLSSYDQIIDHMIVEKDQIFFEYVCHYLLQKKLLHILGELSMKQCRILGLVYYKDIDVIYCKSYNIVCWLLQKRGDVFVIHAKTPVEKILSHLTINDNLNSLFAIISNSYDFIELRKIICDYLSKADNATGKLKKVVNKYLCYILEYSKIKLDHYMDRKRIYSYPLLIKKATQAVKNVNIDYSVIFVDEFQDINLTCLDFLKKIVDKTKARLVCVGDDWQSIYGFSGSRVDVMKNFSDHFTNSKSFFLTSTFRYGLTLALHTSVFVQKDRGLLAKQIFSSYDEQTLIKVISYSNIAIQLDSLLQNIDQHETVIVLVRYKRQFQPLKCIIALYRNVIFLTIHKAKGLEADNVIVLMDEDGRYVFNDYRYTRLSESVYTFQSDDEKYLEERRLFYVATTRAKLKLIFLCKKNYIHPYVKELMDLNIKALQYNNE